MRKENDEGQTPGIQPPSLTGRFKGLFGQFFSLETPDYDEVKVHAPSYDISELAANYVMTLDLPGIPRDRIRVLIKEHELIISAERPARGQGSGFLYRGKPRYGKFKRSFTLPSTVDTENLSARLQDGVLELTLPKKTDLRQIQVEVREAIRSEEAAQIRVESADKRLDS